MPTTHLALSFSRGRGPPGPGRAQSCCPNTPTTAPSAVTAKVQWQSMVTAYKELIKRCRQLGAGS